MSPSETTLSGKVALVTGAGRGIGAAISKTLSQAGATVWLAGRNIASLEALALTMPKARTVIMDVTNEASVKAAFIELRKGSGCLDILINNAGIMESSTLATTRPTSLEAMLRTNVAGAYFCAQMAARLMTARKGGVIVTLSSIMGTQGAPGFSAYAASKAAVIGMTQALSKELAPLQIRVNALAPGFIETDLTAGIEGSAREKALANIGMGRFGRPEDVAAVALFLASPAANYVTGQVIGIDGAMRT